MRFAPTNTANEVWPEGCHNDADVRRRIQARLRSDDVEAKVKLLRELDRFEKGRVAAEENVYRDFRLCQALWASRYTRIPARSPDVANWLMAFPKE